MAKVKSVVLAGKSVNLPHTEFGVRPIYFDKTGLSYAYNSKGEKEAITKKEADGLLEHYNVGFGLEVVS